MSTHRARAMTTAGADDHGAGRQDTHQRERGAVAVVVAILAAALFAMVGLVYDGAQLLSAARQATWQASEAARAGAQELDSGAVLGQPPRLDPVRAPARAQQYLTSVGATGSVTSLQADTIEVRVTHTWYPTFTGLFSSGGREVSGTGTASILRPP